MITGTNISRILTSHVSYKCKCKFNCIKCNSNQNWNNNKCRCECKNPARLICKKDYIFNPATHTCENDRYVGTHPACDVVATSHFCLI